MADHNVDSQVEDDFDLLPTTPNQPAQPRDPSSGKFVPTNPQRTPAGAAPAAQPSQPVHSAYMLAKARQYGIADAESMTPATLDIVLQNVERATAAANVAAATPAVKPPEDEPIDWGTDEEGKPLTEAHYSKPIANAIKLAHESKKKDKKIAELETMIQRDRADRAERAAMRDINSVLASRPDLFGAKPGQAVEGTPEYERYQLVLAHLGRLVQTKKHTTPKADAAKALELFGPSPKGGNRPAAKPSVGDAYAAAELARPNARNGGETLSRRELLIQQEQERQRNNGSYVASTSEDDDADLLD